MYTLSSPSRNPLVEKVTWKGPLALGFEKEARREDARSMQLRFSPGLEFSNTRAQQFRHLSPSLLEPLTEKDRAKKEGAETQEKAEEDEDSDVEMDEERLEPRSDDDDT